MDLKKKFKLFSHKQEDNSIRSVNERIISHMPNIPPSQSQNIDTAFDNLIKEAYTQHHYKSTENPNEENDIISSIARVLFQSPDAFDACVYILKKQEENNFSIDDIYAERSKLRFQLQILSKKISSLILEKSHLYTSELAKVQNLQKDLKLAIDATQSSRRNIQATLSSLSLSCLLLLKNYQHNLNSDKVINQLRVIKDLYQSDIYLRQNIEQKDFYGAIKLCLESRKELIKYSYYRCLSDLNNKLQDTLDMTEEHMDVSLAKTTCYDFDFPPGIHHSGEPDYWGENGLYGHLFKAQALLGKTHTALDQLHMHYTTTIHNRALEVIREYVKVHSSNLTNNSLNPFEYEDENNKANQENIVGTNFKKFQYPELCAMVDPSSFLPCLTKLLATFHNVLLCYYKTIKWYQNHYEQPDECAITGSQGLTSSHNALEEDFTRNYIFQKLKHGILRVWQDMQQKVNIYLTNFAHMALISYDDFIQFLRSISRFLEIGKDFSEDRTSKVVEERLKQETTEYLHSYHCSRTEELKMFLENESWKGCPVKKNFRPSDDFQEFSFLKKVKNAPNQEILGHENLDEANSRVKEKISLVNVCQRFDKYLDQPNPFLLPENSIQTDNVEACGPAAPEDDEDDVIIPTSQFTESDEGDDVTDEAAGKRVNPALLKRRDLRTAARSRMGTKVHYSNRQQMAPILTNSVLTIFRLTGKYLQICSIYPSVTSQVIECVRQLYDIYLYTVYQIVIGKLHYQMVGHLLSETLVNTISRIREESFNDDFYQDFPRNYDHHPQFDAATGASHRAPPNNETIITCQVDPHSSDNDHMIERRGDHHVTANHVIEDYCVAVESLIYLGKVMDPITRSLRDKRAHKAESRDDVLGLPPSSASPEEPWLGWLQGAPSSNDAKVDPVASEILRVACYVISLYVIDYGDVVNLIGTETKWDIRELMSNHSSYINYVIKAYRSFSANLVQANSKFCVPKEFYDTLWQNLISVTFRTIVDGYSNIRKCTNEGRALMQLDLQHLLLNVEDFVAAKDIPDREFIENYIKAYYMPESEIEEWISRHQEYSPKHLSSLVNSMNHLTKKTKAKVLASLEDPERRGLATD